MRLRYRVSTGRGFLPRGATPRPKPPLVAAAVIASRHGRCAKPARRRGIAKIRPPARVAVSRPTSRGPLRDTTIKSIPPAAANSPADAIERARTTQSPAGLCFSSAHLARVSSAGLGCRRPPSASGVTTVKPQRDAAARARAKVRFVIVSRRITRTLIPEWLSSSSAPLLTSGPMCPLSSTAQRSLGSVT